VRVAVCNHPTQRRIDGDDRRRAGGAQASEREKGKKRRARSATAAVHGAVRCGRRAQRTGRSVWAWFGSVRLVSPGFRLSRIRYDSPVIRCSARRSASFRLASLSSPSREESAFAALELGSSVVRACVRAREKRKRGEREEKKNLEGKRAMEALRCPV